MSRIQMITPCLWFDGQGEEAAEFYVSIFEDSEILGVTRLGKAGYECHGHPDGSATTVTFRMAGQEYAALNGGPHFRFNEAISFVVRCRTQEEVDYYWNRLSEGGDPAAQQCGWLKDRFGLTWQVVPEALQDMLHDDDRAGAERMMAELFTMKKIDIASLKTAFEKA